MTTIRKLLVMGSSPASYDLDGKPLHKLIADELQRVDPQTAWNVVFEHLYFARNTIERATTLLDVHKPDVTLAVLDAGMQIARERVTYKLEHRAALAGRLVQWLGENLHRFGKGHRENLQSWRYKLLFSFPRRIAYFFLGAETQVQQKDATALSLSVMQSLVERDIPFIYRLSTVVYVPKDDDPVKDGYAERVKMTFEAHNRPILAFCALYNVPYYDPIDVLEREGPGFLVGPDLVHNTLESRAFEASYVAPLILSLPATQPAVEVAPAT